jgi:acetylglutamate kinase
VIVVKVGGAVSRIAARDLFELCGEGEQICVVHGAGPQISAEMARCGIEIRFVEGRRVTTPEGLDVVRESLAKVNAELCSAIGELALGLMGDEIGLRAVPMSELGLVGIPLPVRPAAIEEALAAGSIPVVAPIAVGPLNVNADDAAAALAVGLGADRLRFLTDVPGILGGGGLVSSIAADEADSLLAAGEFEGGIVPKLHAAVQAARAGVQAEIGATAVVA